jgi:hypothetical protein
MWREVESKDVEVRQTCFSQFVRLVIRASKNAWQKAPTSIPIHRPFPLNSNQKPNKTAIGIPKT